MDHADLINILNDVIIDLQGQVLDAEAMLRGLEAMEIPGADVPQERVLDAVRTLTVAAARIA